MEAGPLLILRNKPALARGLDVNKRNPASKKAGLRLGYNFNNKIT